MAAHHLVVSDKRTAYTSPPSIRIPSSQLSLPSNPLL